MLNRFQSGCVVFSNVEFLVIWRSIHITLRELYDILLYRLARPHPVFEPIAHLVRLRGNPSGVIT